MIKKSDKAFLIWLITSYIFFLSNLNTAQTSNTSPSALPAEEYWQLLWTGSHSDDVYFVNFSSDGSKVLSCSKDNTIKVWNAEDGNVIWTGLHSDDILSANFSPDGSKIVTGSKDNSIKVWDASNGNLLWTGFHSEDVLSVNFNIDGSRVVSGGIDNKVKVWYSAGGIESWFSNTTGWIRIVDFSPDGSKVISGGDDKLIRVWDAGNGALLWSGLHSDWVLSANFSPDGSKLVTGGRDDVLKVWNTSGGNLLWTGNHIGDVVSVSFSPDGSKIISGSYDNKLKVWDANNGDSIWTGSHSSWVTSVNFSSNGEKIVSGSYDNTLKVWNANNGNILWSGSHPDYITSVNFNLSGNRIVSGGWDNSVKVWTYAERSISLISPDGIEYWQVGTNQNITWSSVNITNVKLEYSTDNGTNWNLITESTPANIGRYSWTIPNTPSTQCKVRISDANDPSVNDISNNIFTIYKAPTVFMPTENNLGITSMNGQFGTAWADYDGDGDLDLHIVGSENPNVLYRNENGVVFTDVSVECGFQNSNSFTFGNQPIWFDYDGDGDLDLLVAQGLTLFRNDYGYFSDITNEAGLNSVTDKDRYWSVTVGDYDRDGDLDIAVAGGTQGPNTLYGPLIILNNNNGIYTNVTANVFGLELMFESWGITWVDFDNDNDLDLWIPTIRTPDQGCALLINDKNNFILSNTSSLGINAKSAIVSNWIDYDNDEDMDLLLIPNSGDNDGSIKLYRNSGNNTFTDVANSVGLDSAFTASRGISWGDYDNDGDLDLFVGNRDGVQRLYRNNNNLFVDVSVETGVDFSNNGNRGVHFVDYDNDGFLDIYLSKGDGTDQKLLNNSGNSNHWIVIKPKDSSSPNTPGIGARIRVVAGGLSMIRDIEGSGPGLTNGKLWAHFGLGTATKADSVIIRWPDGTVNIATDVQADKYHNFEKINSSITLIAPNGGEVWEVGTYHYIIWTSNNVSNVKIEYSTSSGNSWETITESTPANDFSYYWKIPDTPSKNCVVRISDASYTNVKDISDNIFTIFKTGSSINVMSPNGGEIWQVNSEHNITWTSSNITNVKIEYTTDNGTSWFAIIESTAAEAGSFNWIIPNTVSMQCKIRISDITNTAINDLSDNVFAISEIPFAIITITSPNGGEYWFVNSIQDITWTSSNVSYVKIEYSTDNGNSWNNIINDKSADLVRYTWHIPYTPSAFCKVKISDQNNPDVYDVSDNVFEIFEIVPEITVTSPNGGESWKAGTNQIISWISINVANLKIEYTTNNGDSWAEVIQNLPANDQSYNWTIPNTPSVNCRIKISSTLNENVNDESDGVFTIRSEEDKSITLLSPNGGETLMVGSVHNITWSSSNISNVKIEYSTNNGGIWSSIIENTPAVGGKYTWTIPPSVSNYCKIKISDTTDGTINDESDELFKIFEYPGSINVVKTYSFENITSTTSYKIIGVPGLSNFLISSILNGTPKIDWTAYWDNGEPVNYQVEYNGSASFFLRPGRAFWILSKNPISLSRTVNTVPLNTDNTYTINLHQGWNLISNPFDHSIPWEEIKRFNPVITQKIWSYEGRYNESLSFEPYKGYYFYNNTNISGLKVPYLVSSLGKVTFAKSDKIKIILKTQIKEVGCIELAFDERSENGLDIYDIYSPSSYFIDADVSIVHNDGVSRNDYLKTDIRPNLGDGQEYCVEVINRKADKLFIKLAENSIGKEIYLIDDNLKKVYQLENEFSIPSTFKNKKYRLVIGSKEYIDKLTSEYTPVDINLFQNFPNPFNPSTLIRFSINEKRSISLNVYNILGEHISTLIDREEVNPGYYEMEFNGLGLSSGVYLVQLRIGEIYKSIKMLLTK